MGLIIDRAALDQLADLLLERVGLKIPPEAYYGLRLALKARLPTLGLVNAAEYVEKLKCPPGEQELRFLLPLVTVGKTDFFRDSGQFSAFEDHVFPAVHQRAVREGRQAKVWSAGCATGEEPYSLSMVALEKGGTPQSVEILATDLNPAATLSASRGCFHSRRLVGVSEARLARFFSPMEDGHALVPEVRELIRFEGHNLAAAKWPQIEAGSFDVIFCRNVIIYFDQPTVVGVMERFYESLRPGGWMFLGYSESLFRVSTRFEMVEVGGTFLYQRPLITRRPAVRSVPEMIPVPKTPRVREHASQPALAHKKTKARKVTAPSPAEPKAPPRNAIDRLSEVVTAIERGEFPKALSEVRVLVEAEPDHLAAWLTLGNVHALMGNLDPAKDAYQRALAREPLCVEARLYTALAAIQVGRLEEARQELNRALFLEPTLAVGHYLLGQVNELQQAPVAAIRSYRNAVAQRAAPKLNLIGYFPDLPTSNEAIARAAQHRLTALSG